MKTILIILSLVTSLAANSEEIKLAFISSDIDQNTSIYSLETTPTGTMDSMRMVTWDHENKVIEDLVHPSERIMNGGVTLVQRQGRDAVRMEVEDFSVEKGGIIVLDFLYNGIRGSRKSLKLRLQKEGDLFVLYDLAGNKVNKFFFSGNFARIVGCIGIKEI